MKRFDKLIKKYANPPVILPPESEDDFEMPSLKAPKVPEIKELTEEEMQKWDDYIKEQNLIKDLEKTIKINDEEESKRAPESGTMPAIPGKKANVDAILRQCDLYYKLTNK